MNTSRERDVRALLKQEISRLKEGAIAPDQVPDDLPLFDLSEGQASLGLDSLDALELVMAVEDNLHVSSPKDLDFKELATVDQIVAFVIRLSEHHCDGNS